MLMVSLSHPPSERENLRQLPKGVIPCTLSSKGETSVRGQLGSQIDEFYCAIRKPIV